MDRQDKKKTKTVALDTTHKGGRAPPHVSLQYVKNDLVKYLKGFKGLQDAEKIMKKKYTIATDTWNDDDITRVWGKTTRLYKYSRKRKILSLAILLQMIVRDDLSPSPNKTGEEDDSTKRKSTKRKMICSNERINVGENEETESQHFSCETQANINVGANAGTERQNSTSQTPSNINVGANEGTESQYNICANKKSRKGKDKDKEERDAEIYKSKLRSFDHKTKECYIRIPLSLMDVSTDVTSFPQTQQVGTGCKLIDGVPSFTKTMTKTSYVMQYDNRTRNAAWVFEILNKESLQNNLQIGIEESEDNHTVTFIPDSSIHNHFRAVYNKDSYKVGQYDRGHLAAAANHRWSKRAFDDTYLHSNMTPQNNNLNKSAWRALENDCRDYANTNNNVYVYSGPLYLPKPIEKPQMTYKILGNKAVPSDFFKVIILEKVDGTLDVICYTVANADSATKQKTDLDNIERLSGLVFREYSQSVSNKEERVTVQWKAKEENGETKKVDTTFTIITSKHSRE